MESQFPRTVWCYISDEAAGEIWNWSQSLWGDVCLALLRLLRASPYEPGWPAWPGHGPARSCVHMRNFSPVNPFSPKSDQSPISPVASPEILHHTVWRTWLSIAQSDERWLHYQFSLPPIHLSLGRLGECSFWTRGAFNITNKDVATKTDFDHSSSLSLVNSRNFITAA